VVDRKSERNHDTQDLKIHPIIAEGDPRFLSDLRHAPVD
jgi:hypothetical protein